MRRRVLRWMLVVLVLTAAVGGSMFALLRAAPARPHVEAVVTFSSAGAAAAGWTADEQERFRQAFAARFADRGWYTRDVLGPANAALVPQPGGADAKAEWVVARVQARWVTPDRLAVGLHDADPAQAEPLLRSLVGFAEATVAEVLPGRHGGRWLEQQTAQLERLWGVIQETERLAGASDQLGSKRAAFELPLLKDRYRHLFVERMDAEDRFRRADIRQLLTVEPVRVRAD